MELEFEFERETKNTYRYKEVERGKPPVIKTLYIAKWALEKKPEKLKVVISDTV